MQGTHQLNLDDGRLVLLQTTDGNLNLDVYLGKRVEVRGSVEPTVESGGLIMHVEEVTILELADSSSSESQQVACGGFAGLKCPDAAMDCIDNPNDECDPANGGADCIGMCVTAQVGSIITSPSGGSGSGSDNPIMLPETSVLFSGIAYPNAIVTLLKDGVEKTKVTANKDAYFSITLFEEYENNALYTLFAKDIEGGDASGH
jgi:hypothetical protein